jgi:predicted Zn-dependent protease
MGRVAYYLLWFGLAYAMHYPWLVGGAVIAYIFRGFLPDPVIWLRTQHRMRGLRSDIAANPANATARRDLAKIYLERRRPRPALALLDEALARHPDDAELLYLKGVAHVRAGEPEAALGPLVRAVELRPGLLYGEPYRVAADALMAAGRYEEAEDALERYIGANSSSIEGHVKLARVRGIRGDAAGRRAALKEALDTWTQVPAFKKRHEVGWWLEAHLRRLFS